MLELLASGIVIYGNGNGLWSPNNSVWFLPTTPPVNEQLYEPQLESIENNEHDKRVL